MHFRTLYRDSDYFHSGQDCTAGSRVFVQSSVYDKFVRKLLELSKEFVVGDPFDDNTAAGPVISKVQYDRVWGYIDTGKQEGAKVILGGEKRKERGFFVDPCSKPYSLQCQKHLD